MFIAWCWRFVVCRVKCDRGPGGRLNIYEAVGKTLGKWSTSIQVLQTQLCNLQEINQPFSDFKSLFGESLNKLTDDSVSVSLN